MSDHAGLGASWHYEDSGDGREPLVLLHGFTGCGAVWAEIVASLNDEFRCIAPDLPGHGRTQLSRDLAMFRMRHTAETLGQLLAGLGLQKTMVWGYSMGGRLALMYATMFPDRVSRLVLESASPGLADPIERQKRQESDEQLAKTIEADGSEKFVNQWETHPLFALQRELPVAKQERMRAIRLANTAIGLAMNLRGMGTGAQESLHDRLPQLRVPALILVGEMDAKFRAIGEYMADCLPTAQLRIVPGAGHTTFWEQPGACLRIVRPFLRGEEPPDLLPGGK